MRKSSGVQVAHPSSRSVGAVGVPCDAAVASLVDKYAPEIAEQLQEARRHLREHFPRGYELVYDNYNALVFAYSASERGSDAVVSIAGYPKWVTLFFASATTLEDPAGLLEGSGSQFRSIRLQPLARLHEPAVERLIAAARQRASAEFQDAPPLATIVKSISTKQRARRPAAVQAAGRASDASGVAKRKP